MTLDGKIATAAGHAAWVTSPDARRRVFRQRALSDAVIVGGQVSRISTITRLDHFQLLCS